jgi:hypothetical protein
MIALSTARAKSPAFLGDAIAASLSHTADAPATLTQHLQAMHAYGARQQYRRNETIFNQGDEAAQVYRIVDGTVRW